jgi:ABC-type amino acid transport substrate-binding protein
VRLRGLARAAAGLALAALAACAGTPDGPRPLLVGSDLDNPPFAFLQPDGVPAGRDVEMMQDLARRLGRPLVWMRLPFDQLLPAAREGRVDLVCATLGVTPEREETLDFSAPYFRTQLAVVVAEGPAAPRTLADLAGRLVGAGRGTTSERALRLSLPAALPVLENKAGLPALARLRSGDVDALVMDGPAADALVAAAGGRLRRLAESLGPEHYALVLPQGSPLRATLDRALLEHERDGSAARLDAAHGLLSVRPR